MNQIIIETQNSIQQPYSNVYNSDSFQIDLNDPLREFLFFLPDHSIQIQIIDHEVEPAIVNLLHTNVYTISVKHAQFSWTIKRKYKNFLKLYEAYALFKTKLNIRNATHTNNLPQITNPTPNETTTTAAASNANRFKSSDHFKLFFQSIASDFTHSKHILEKFLQDVVDNKIFRNHNETLKFLEVSHLSFVSELGDKNKEGLIKKHAFSIRFCSSASSGLNYFCATRWLIVKDTWVAYLEPKTGEIRTVLLVDKLFRVQSGLAGTGERSGLLIENLSKNLFVKCYNEKRANEWRYAIQYMLDTTGKEFCSLQPARFEAFAPVRYGCKTRWFVDGADYMESIADSIQSATEEIFITGFFLSPEIYLKRPVLVGDKWRLDKLLKQKAEQGVKIYILIYKEIEITLPINSAYSKRTLSHKNIKVLRHPDHLNGPIMWAHHEKLVIIDQSVAYFGGLDLCYGRWDDHCHRLTDLGSVISSSSSSSSSSSPSSNSPKQVINKKFQLQTIDETTLIPTVPIESVSSSTRSKLSKENNSVRLLKFDNKRHPHLSTIFNNSHAIINSDSTIITNPDENNNTKSEKKSSVNTEELSTIKTKLKKLKPMRMLSTPATTGSHDSDPEILSRNFLIDNMTDYYNNFIKKDSTNVYCAEENETEMKKENKTSRFERLFNRVENLKRSKSLELSNALAEERIETCVAVPTIRDESLLVTTSNLTHSLKALHQHEQKQQQQQQRETFAENSIFNKLKKIKQFKESLRKYAIPNASPEKEDENKLISALNSTKNNQGNQLPNNLQGSTKLWIGKDYCNFIFKDVKNVHSPFQDSINRTTTPRMPWHDIAGCVYGSAARDIARHFIERWNYIKTKKMRNNKSYFQLVPKSYQNLRTPVDTFYLTNTATPNSNNFSTCNVQTLRSVSNWSAGISKTETSIHSAMKHLIRTSKHYIYIENQFFISLIDDNLSVKNEIALCIYDRIVRAVNEKENFKVYVFLPLIPGYEGEYGKLKSSGVLLHTITHYNNATINGLIKKLTDASIDPLNYIFFFGLRTSSELNNRLITEIIYVHSKLMIVDDRACIIGSANINDRSLLGNRDSEVALYIEDTQFKNALLNKKPTQVGLFTSSLRHRLFREFLGELNTSNEFIDPCSDEFYKQVLIKHASQNTHIYDLVFKVIPCDYVSNFEQLREYQKLACLNQTDTAKAREELKRVKGYVVLYPNRFLVHQDLTPPLGTKEKLLPTILWT